MPYYNITKHLQTSAVDVYYFQSVSVKNNFAACLTSIKLTNPTDRGLLVGTIVFYNPTSTSAIHY